MDDAGESGVQFSFGTETEAYGGKQQLQITNFATSLGWSQAGNPGIANLEKYNW